MVHACRPCGNTRCFQNQRFSSRFVGAFILLLVLSPVVFCQVETATISGVITDQSGAVVAGAEVRVTNTDTNGTWVGTSNGSGVYLVTGLKPGSYRIHVAKEGFKTIDLTDLTLNVQDSVSRNFSLQVGSASESVSIEAQALQINTTDATVSTVVDRQFAENLPLNGRSFQTLIELTPGVVLTANNPNDTGQFSVNGQRAGSNYWMVDGVSANIGISSTSNLGNGFTGSLGSFSVQGGTNSLVSVDALQEFRIQTSTYAPEFGRAPGGQISIVTRSGTNQFHGTAFDYLRNDLFDANNWFNNAVPPPAGPLPKAQERQNDFGGTFSGPVLKNKTFFFFSYEGLRLRLPQTALTSVPDVTARQNAAPALQPYLNAFPQPNGPDDTTTGVAQFNASYSDPATLDAYSLRIDHRLNDKLTLFGRYNYSPSSALRRGNGDSLSTVSPSHITTQTGTLGVTWAASPTLANDLRFNYSRTHAYSSFLLDNFGGAVPLPSFPFPSSFTSENASFSFGIFSLAQGFFAQGRLADNVQRQINVIDSVSIQRGAHALKFGIDYRRLSPSYRPQLYLQQAQFLDVPSAETGSLFRTILLSSRNVTMQLNNVGVFAQDTWRVSARLTATYGLRWDVDFAPSSNPSFPAVTGFNLNDLSNLALAPAGTPPFETTYGNVAPRIGLAYQVSRSQNWSTVLRGGFGLFFDLATQEIGNNVFSSSYPFGTSSRVRGGTFPLDPATAAPPPITVAGLTTHEFSALDPNLKLPYSREWNVAVEQELGRQQTVSASYIGSVGRRLLQSALVIGPNPNFLFVQLVGNTARSDYNALQLQFQRRLARGLQVLTSYTWSHSIDDGSAGSSWNFSNLFVPTANRNANRGPSDFDIRNTFTAGVTYDIPFSRTNRFTNAILGGWSLQSIVQARSAPPVDVSDTNFFSLGGGISADVRPDLVSGQPLYLFGSQYPGGKAFNPIAFTNPPTSPTGCNPAVDFPCDPIRQGNVGRNALRGFGATQWDFAVHRDFPLRERLKLQFRAEMFNVLNHPNFGQPDGSLTDPTFGLSTQMLGQYLSGGVVGAGALSPLYQIGGPRSVQLALKLMF